MAKAIGQAKAIGWYRRPIIARVRAGSLLALERIIARVIIARVVSLLALRRAAIIARVIIARVMAGATGPHIPAPAAAPVPTLAGFRPAPHYLPQLNRPVLFPSADGINISAIGNMIPICRF
jgi:hypothetical protein